MSLQCSLSGEIVVILHIQLPVIGNEKKKLFLCVIDLFEIVWVSQSVCAPVRRLCTDFVLQRIPAVHVGNHHNNHCQIKYLKFLRN